MTSRLHSREWFRASSFIEARLRNSGLEENAESPRLKKVVHSQATRRTICSVSCLFLLLLLGQTTSVAGQNQTSGASENPAQVSAPTSRENIVERPVSWKLIAPNIMEDQKAIWAFPVDLAHGKNWKPVLGVVAATAAFVALDPHDTPYFRRTSSFTGFNNALSGRNTILGMAVFPASFYVAGLARKDSYAEHTALLAGEAVADTEILATLMKDAGRRLRPSDISPNGNFSDTWTESRGSVLGTYSSFPSGHTIVAFSIATIFAERYHKHRWVPWVSYGLAGLVGFSRVSLQAHFPSDVFVGAALGYFISRDVVLAGERH